MTDCGKEANSSWKSSGASREYNVWMHLSEASLSGILYSGLISELPNIV